MAANPGLTDERPAAEGRGPFECDLDSLVPVYPGRAAHQVVELAARISVDSTTGANWKLQIRASIIKPGRPWSRELRTLVYLFENSNPGSGSERLARDLSRDGFG